MCLQTPKLEASADPLYDHIHICFFRLGCCKNATGGQWISVVFVFYHLFLINMFPIREGKTKLGRSMEWEPWSVFTPSGQGEGKDVRQQSLLYFGSVGRTNQLEKRERKQSVSWGLVCDPQGPCTTLHSQVDTKQIKRRRGSHCWLGQARSSTHSAFHGLLCSPFWCFDSWTCSRAKVPLKQTKI